jgi:hypothetical protein
MDPACILVTGIMCMSPEYVQVTSRVTMHQTTDDVLPAEIDPASVQRLGVSVYISAGGHVIEYWPLRALNKLCSGSVCIYYRKTCDERQKICSYADGPSHFETTETGTRERFMPEEFIIHYQSEAALREAESHIFIVAGPKDQQRHIPLTGMTVLTTGDDEPSCRYPTTEPGC